MQMNPRNMELTIGVFSDVSPEILGFVVVVVVIVVGIFFSWRHQTRVRRWIRNAWRKAPRVALASAPDGTRVVVRGRVTGITEPLRSPLTRSPCAAYTLLVELHSRKNDMYTPIFEERCAARFLVSDTSGTAWVLARGAHLELGCDELVVFNWETRPTAEALAILERHGYVMEPGDLDRRRFSECRLDEGDFVELVGHVRSIAPAEAACLPDTVRPSVTHVVEADPVCRVVGVREPIFSDIVDRPLDRPG